MSIKEKILRLLYLALIDIRAAADQGNTKACFVLSDLMHNIPLQILRVEKENGNYQEIMYWIRMRCKQNKCESWLDNAISQL
jgi:hypothetical protein